MVYEKQQGSYMISLGFLPVLVSFCSIETVSLYMIYDNRYVSPRISIMKAIQMESSVSCQRLYNREQLGDAFNGKTACLFFVQIRLQERECTERKNFHVKNSTWALYLDG